MIGNPPWILLGWNEQDLLADYRPLFAIRSISASDTARLRNEELSKDVVKEAYISEFESIAGMESFYCASQNYSCLSGMKTNLYKCFLPQAWQFAKENGISAFIHPEGVYDDPKGGELRKELYPRLRRHYQFRNELKLFSEVHHSRVFGLNVYCNRTQSTFDSINNLFSAETIEECYSNRSKKTVGIKNDKGEWATSGNYDRVLKIGNKQLEVFGRIFDIDDWKGTKLLALHSTKLLNAVSVLSCQKMTVGKTKGVYISEMWNETNAQRDGTITRQVGFPESPSLLIMAGSQIGVATPMLKTPRRVCVKNSDFDAIDLTEIADGYLPRSNYVPGCDIGEYYARIPVLDSGIRYDQGYRIFARKMIDPEGARTLVSALIPPMIGHTSGISGIYTADERELLLALGSFCSLPIDYLLKATAKANFQASTIRNIPIVSSNSVFSNPIIARVLQLNALSSKYDDIWDRNKGVFDGSEVSSKQDVRVVCSVRGDSRASLVLKNDYARRQALVEIDVLVCMAFGITLDELKTMYKLQFHILQSQEDETYYDRNGRIVYTNNRAIAGVGYDRREWENGIQGATAGQKFYRTITDDTMPGGPVERTIEYVAPFDRCDREQDYETAWNFFEEKYGKQG